MKHKRISLSFFFKVIFIMIIVNFLIIHVFIGESYYQTGFRNGRARGKVIGAMRMFNKCGQKLISILNQKVKDGKNEHKNRMENHVLIAKMSKYAFRYWKRRNNRIIYKNQRRAMWLKRRKRRYSR